MESVISERIYQTNLWSVGKRYIHLDISTIADGSLARPFGKMGTEVTLEQGSEIACKVGLSILGSLQRTIGDLDCIAGWARVFGMVNSAPGFDRHPVVINGFSELILAVFDPEVGRHARSAVGVAGLPFNIAVEIEAEILLHA